jgi:hypothetical protein
VISNRILEYSRSLPDHRSGTVEVAVLRAIEELAPSPLNWTMETGCGKTTILLSNLSRRHHVFCLDDRAEQGSSIAYVTQCPLYRPAHTHFVLGPTQRTLPTFIFDQQIDLVLLDGPHGYPFPELEYFFVYPQLRTGALMVIDDIHIPTIHRLYSFLAEDDMFDLVHVEQTTAFFHRTSASALDPCGDGWWLQSYNKTRFPIASPTEILSSVGRELQDKMPANSTVGTQAGGQLHQLKSDNAALRKQLALWQHIAEERRLSRRLVRRLPILKRWL